MLKIWTSADQSTIDKTIGAALKTFRPKIPPHQFFDVMGGVLPVYPGEVGLVCGTTAVTLLQQEGLAAKNRTVTSLRETILKNPAGGRMLVTYDPTIVGSDPSKGEIIHWDMRLAVRLYRTGKLAPTVGQYRFVPDFTDLIDRINTEFYSTSKPVDVAMDTETMTFHPWYPENQIVSIAFTLERNTADVLYCGPNFEPVPLTQDPPNLQWRQIHWLLTSPRVRLRMANGKYDLVWIKEKWDIDCTNFALDTMLVGSLLNENRSNSLNLHAKLFTDIGGYDDQFNLSEDKSHMELIDPSQAGPGYLTYQGGDTDACQTAADVLKTDLLEDPALANLYVNVIHPASRAFEKIERHGILVDQDKYAKLGDDLTTEINSSTLHLMDMLPQAIKAKHMDKIDDQLAEGKSPLVDQVLRDYFFSTMGLNLKPKVLTEKKKEPSMTKAHLKMFFDNDDAKAFVAELEKLDSASKTKSTFVDGFVKHIRPDGRLHPQYMLFHGGMFGDEDDESGTVSGRLSAKFPAIQTLPAKTKYASRLRECFIAPPGKAILAVDYSQGELKIVACIAPEKTMIQAYRDGIDLHALTGATLSSTPIETFLSWKTSDNPDLKEAFDLFRARAKPANFGLVYGMQAEGFQRYAWGNYGLMLTLEEAEAMRAKFFALYPDLLTYHSNMRTLVRAHAEVRSPLGRARHLPTIRSWDKAVNSYAERQAINSPVQSTLTDMMIWAIHLMQQELGDLIDIFAMIHDAVYLYVDLDKVQAIAKQVTAIMSTLPLEKVFGWKPQLVFTSEAKAGTDLGHLKDVKLAA